MSLIISLLIGGIAGFLAGTIKRGAGFGFLGNIGIGLLGSFIGGLLIGDSSNILLQIIISTIGALILLFVANLVTSKS